MRLELVVCKQPSPISPTSARWIRSWYRYRRGELGREDRSFIPRQAPPSDLFESASGYDTRVQRAERSR
jgi:hypothetical protein